MHSSTHTIKHTHTCSHIHTHMLTYTHTHTHTHTYTHTCIWLYGQKRSLTKIRHAVPAAGCRGRGDGGPLHCQAEESGGRWLMRFSRGAIYTVAWAGPTLGSAQAWRRVLHLPLWSGPDLCQKFDAIITLMHHLVCCTSRPRLCVPDSRQHAIKC